MQFTAHQISLLLSGTVEGDPNVAVDKLAKIEDAKTGALSFLANPKYEHFLYTTNASVVIINKDLALTQPVNATLVRVDNAYSAFSVILEQYNTIKLDKKGIEQPSFIHPDAQIGNNVYIGAFSYIGSGAKIGDNARLYPHTWLADNVKIGNNTTLFSGVKVYFDCVLGNDVIIHANAVIGSDGFGFAPTADGSYKKVSQIGNVIIEDNVEIGAGTIIDRATMGSTIIKKGVKLDNLIQVAHNVEVGSNTVIAAQSGISGSTKIGENCVVGGQVGMVGHITIANGSQFQAQSGVSRNITEENKKWAGTPAVPFTANQRAHINTQKLPELERRVQELEKIIAELRNVSI